MYPFGQVCAVTLDIAHTSPQPLPDSVGTLIKAVRSPVMRNAQVRELASQSLPMVNQGLDPNVPANNRQAQEFRITTVLSGSIDTPDFQKDSLAEAEVASALLGLAGQEPDWSVSTPKIDAARLKLRGAASNVGYWMNTGAAFWLPFNFTSPGHGRNGCYHRNQLLSTLHVVSLCDLVEQNHRPYEQGSLPQREIPQTRRAAEALNRAYAGNGTYRSLVAQRLIRTRAVEPAINSINSRAGSSLPPIPDTRDPLSNWYEER